MKLPLLVRVVVSLLPAVAALAEPDTAALPQAAAAALHRAVTFYATEVADHGGYVYYYSPDLQQRWGEGVTAPGIIWVQPPGTPTVGLAYLVAYNATGERAYLEAAQAAAAALVYGQLESGGWTNKVCFVPAERMGKYRNGRGDSWNMTSLDDGQTQAALRLLIRVDAALRFRDAEIHEAVKYGLDALLAHQFPSGGFPQGWDDDELPQPRPRPASYPDYDWRTEGRIKNYWDLYTLNDDNAVHLAETLIAAQEVYAQPRLGRALEKLGDFLILAQMPEPQPAWAQQYRYDMRPAWARPFEPPAISSAESMGVIETLIRIARYTGQRKYLRPVPAALAYLRRCVLPDGRLARFYELETNKPLFVVRQGRRGYGLTHDDADLPRHYAWKVASRLDALQRAYRLALAGRSEPAPLADQERVAQVRAIVTALDAQGRWISRATGERLIGQPRFEQGQAFISSAVFAERVELLSKYLHRER